MILKTGISLKKKNKASFTEHRYKNLQQNLSKLNPTAYQKDHILQFRWDSDQVCKDGSTYANQLM